MILQVFINAPSFLHLDTDKNYSKEELRVFYTIPSKITTTLYRLLYSPTD